MTAAFVVDSSVAMSWLFKDEVRPATEKILDRLDSETALVPALWYLELTNVMALAERSGCITALDAEQFILQLSKLEFDVDSESPQRVFSHVLPLCRAHRLTSYDALYLELAIRRRLPLATLDEPLRKAAKKLGVNLLGR